MFLIELCSCLVFVSLHKNQIMQEAKRYFNTSGPNIRAQHYTLERPALIAKGLDLVHNERYFTIWAPRQTGKSTYFRMLAEVIEKEGYKVCHVNTEHLMQASMESFLLYLSKELTEQWGIDFTGLSLEDIFSKIYTIKDKKYIFIIDEIEGINSDYFNQFLHTGKRFIINSNTHCCLSVLFAKSIIPIRTQ